MRQKIKVMVVDDSAIVRQAMKDIIAGNDELELIATASNPIDAAEKMKREVPDVLVLDIQMPEMDGITFLKKLMSQYPLPVVICSSMIESSPELSFSALKYGAVELINKPKLNTRLFFEESKIIIVDAIKAAFETKVKKLAKEQVVTPKLSADVIIAKPNTNLEMITTDKIIILGSSTGGTEAIESIFSKLKPNVPPIVVVQHMPEHFTASFANRLNSMSQITVKEASDGDRVRRGFAYIAQGNRHLLLKRTDKLYHLEIKEGPLVSRHRPSVDVLFRSAARYAGKNAIGIILTGMGDDGAKGMLEMKQAGAFNIAEDEKSCVVFGMPKEAIKIGAVDKILNLQEITDTINKYSES